MTENYTVYHLHSDLSTGVTNIDSVTKYQQYVDRAKECGMTAMAFSEHGSVFEWLHKKRAIEAAGMKYIHAIEVYVTEQAVPTDSTLKNVRDNYHCVLIAKNFEGFKEINKLSSGSFDRNDGHFYYNPRITFDELIHTSDNVLITTACLGGILHNAPEPLKQRFEKFLTKNKHRCFLEIQHHMEPEQISYNQYLMELGARTGIPLIAGTDTHALNAEHLDVRSVLQTAKNVNFANEDAWNLSFKTYDELVGAYEKQDSIPREKYMEAIHNTNVMADMIEEYEIDDSKKYPQLYNDSEAVFKQKIVEGMKWRGIDKLPNLQEYVDRVNYEMDTYRHNGAIDFMLLEEDYKAAMRKKTIYPGYSRGSVSGSIIAYLLGITEVDSIKHGLNFERFMNKERVSLADVDSDWYDDDREAVRKYLYNKDGLYCCDIITFNTIKLKGAIKDICRGLYRDNEDVDHLKLANEIIALAEIDEDKARQQYPEIFKYVDIANGVVVSVGNHPAGVVVSPFPVEGEFGTFTSKTNKYPISQINMKEIDSLNYVKLDILGLSNNGLINKTCELAGIERLTPNNTPLEEAVWKSIRDDTTLIFQWESDSAASYLKHLFSDETIAKIKAKNPNFSYMDLLSIGNGAIRPAGASYRNELASGEFRDNGNDALNEMLAPTLGFLVFQEQIIQFLHEFCGYTMGEADIVRRGFAKKTGTEKFIPKIKSGFIATMKEKYGVEKDEAERLIVNFIKVIEDASDYLFSLNHADPYSWIGYVCGYLRYHYPLEFLTSALNIFEDKEEKTLSITEYARSRDISIEPIKFRYSLSEYTCDKEKNCIFKGMKSIKYLNKRISKQLYELRDRKFEDFYDLLRVIGRETSVDSRQLEILIKLDFFSEFGNPNQLMCQTAIFAEYFKEQGALQLNKDKATPEEVMAVMLCEHDETEKLYRIPDRMEFIRCFDRGDDIKTPVRDRLGYEMKHLGYINIKIPKLTMDYAFVMDVNDKYANRVITLYRLNNGEIDRVKVKKKVYESKPILKGMIIRTVEASQERRWKKTPDGFVQIDEYETILKKWCEVK